MITQKIAVNTPTQPAPSQLPAQPPLVSKQQPVPAADKPQPTPEKTMTATQPSPTATPAKAKQTPIYREKPVNDVPSPLTQDRTTDKTTDKPEPVTIDGTPIAAETSEQDSDSKASETDLEKLIADAAGSYSPAGKVDPFLPLFEEKPAAPEESADAVKQKKKRRMPLTPLERVDLSQLKLVGIIQAPSGNKALVEEASGKGYIIKKGTFIGIHAGRVLEIQKDRVVVEEEVENVLGQFTLEKKELKLQKPPGEF